LRGEAGNETTDISVGDGVASLEATMSEMNIGLLLIAIAVATSSVVPYMLAKKMEPGLVYPLWHDRRGHLFICVGCLGSQLDPIRKTQSVPANGEPHNIYASTIMCAVYPVVFGFSWLVESEARERKGDIVIGYCVLVPT
jgi:hypothetical protein